MAVLCMLVYTHIYGLPEEILSSVHDKNDLDRALAASGIERLEPDVATPVFLETEAFSDPEESVQEQNDPELLPQQLSLETRADPLPPSSPVGTDLDSTMFPDETPNRKRIRAACLHGA